MKGYSEYRYTFTSYLSIIVWDSPLLYVYFCGDNARDNAFHKEDKFNFSLLYTRIFLLSLRPSTRYTRHSRRSDGFNFSLYTNLALFLSRKCKKYRTRSETQHTVDLICASCDRASRLAFFSLLLRCHVNCSRQIRQNWDTIASKSKFVTQTSTVTAYACLKLECERNFVCVRMSNYTTDIDHRLKVDAFQMYLYG